VKSHFLVLFPTDDGIIPKEVPPGIGVLIPKAGPFDEFMCHLEKGYLTICHLLRQAEDKRNA